MIPTLQIPVTSQYFGYVPPGLDWEGTGLPLGKLVAHNVLFREFLNVFCPTKLIRFKEVRGGQFFITFIFNNHD
jgi:hypothetical protein